ncbi:unnamed protein product [Amoebophrya sp. A120]|nr:unnamed protein product [Amoebophrya sp. A120]|eukprot:GSA120T00016661001.1
MSIRDSARGFALSVVQYGQSWWFPFLICVVSITNSLTAGALIWCVGVMQGTLYSTFLLSNPGLKGILIGPMTLCTGSTVAAYTYMSLMKSGGAEYVLEKTGLMGSDWIETAADYGQKYGMFGLFLIQVSPAPVPTAILVITGMLSGIPEWQIYGVVTGAKYCQLVLGATLMQYTLLQDGKSLDEVLDEHVFGNKPKTEIEMRGKADGDEETTTAEEQNGGTARQRGRGRAARK